MITGMKLKNFFKTEFLVVALLGAVTFGYIAGRFVSQTNLSEGEEAMVISTVKKSTLAVVSIIVSKNIDITQQNRSRLFEDFCRDPFFRDFLGPQCETASPSPQPQIKKQQVAAGTGFLVRADGLIVTNKHVVDIDQAEFTVQANDGGKYPAKLLFKDPLNDLALLKIEGVGFPVLPLGDSDKIQIGQSVMAIGNALGEFSNTVSRGVVSGLSRSITAQAGASAEKLEKLIQTDAAINPGNSGGPLLNLRGEVLGINTAIAAGAQSVGFAIPVNQIKKSISEVVLQERK